MASIRIGHASDVGRKRDHNEDAYVALLPPNTPEGVDAVLAVADGMGGHQAGEVASNIAVQILANRFSTKDSTLMPGSDKYADLLRSAVEQANAEIIMQAVGEAKGMGTTLTAALIANDCLYFGHVGDSRAYIFSRGELRHITDDHSWVAEEVRAGRLTNEEAASHPRRNLITRALGTDSSVVVDTGSFELHPKDVVLISSDGLHGVVDDEDIQKVLKQGKSLQETTDKLVAMANANGGPDNVTVILAEYLDVASGESPKSKTQTTMARNSGTSPTSRNKRPWWKLFGPSSGR